MVDDKQKYIYLSSDRQSEQFRFLLVHILRGQPHIPDIVETSRRKYCIQSDVYGPYLDPQIVPTCDECSKPERQIVYRRRYVASTDSSTTPM